MDSIWYYHFDRRHANQTECDSNIWETWVSRVSRFVASILKARRTSYYLTRITRIEFKRNKKKKRRFGVFQAREILEQNKNRISNFSPRKPQLSRSDKVWWSGAFHRNESPKTLSYISGYWPNVQFQYKTLGQRERRKRKMIMVRVDRPPPFSAFNLIKTDGTVETGHHTDSVGNSIRSRHSLHLPFTRRLCKSMDCSSKSVVFFVLFSSIHSD